MLRVLHLADARLGARHVDLGDAAAQQRERQFEALGRAVDIALAEHAELVVIAGDLFATNVEPRRTVERAAAVLARLVGARVRTVILPGTADRDGRASVYRAYDLGAMAGAAADDDLITVLAADRPWVHLSSLDAVVVGAVASGAAGDADGASAWPARLAALSSTLPAAAWRIGAAHAGLLPVEAGDAAITATGADYLALGGSMQPASGVTGGVAWGMPGSPEQVGVDRTEPGSVLLVTMDLAEGSKHVLVERHATGRTVHRAVTVDVAGVASQAALVEELRAGASPDDVLDVRLEGVRPDELVVEPAEVEDALRADVLRIRVLDASLPGLTEGELPPADTVAGAFVRGVEAQIAELEAAEAEDAAPSAEAAELREVLRLGRRLLAGEEVGA